MKEAFAIRANPLPESAFLAAPDYWFTALRLKK